MTLAATSSHTPTDDRWLSVTEISSYLGVKPDTVYKWINRKQLPAHKVGRLWKFRRLEVDHWVFSGSANARPGSDTVRATLPARVASSKKKA